VQSRHASEEEDVLIPTQINGSSRTKPYSKIDPSIVLESIKHGLSGVRRLGRTQTNIGFSDSVSGAPHGRCHCGARAVRTPHIRTCGWLAFVSQEYPFLTLHYLVPCTMYFLASCCYWHLTTTSAELFLKHW